MNINRTDSPRKVCVMGAGIVGLATAWELAQQGHEVVIVDRAEPGSGASYGNGAQLSYAHVQPLADPSIWKQLPKLLLDQDSPLRWKLALDPHQWHWLMQFMLACRTDMARNTTRTMLALASRSHQAFERFRSGTGIDCDYAASGKLVIYPDEASFTAARQLMQDKVRWGAVQQALSRSECLDIEPALAYSEARFVGGIYTPGDSAADCFKICQALETRLRQRGVSFVLGATIQQLVVRGGLIREAQTSLGAIEADQFVLSLGSGSRAVARPLGVDLPIYPLKGYSITCKVKNSGRHAPHTSLTDASRKVVFARVGDRIRVAGIVELVGDDTRIDPQRIASLVASAKTVFPEACDWGPDEAWAGLRPSTPTSVPLVGLHPKAPANLLLNTGHGMLGFTLAFGSAETIAEQLRA